jgi:site-specific DNA recombinase
MKAAIYVRVSSSKQEDNFSLPSQEKACRNYALERGYSVRDDQVYREVYSAEDIWHRPRLAELRAAIEAGHADIVVAYEPKRISRDPDDAIYLAVEAKRWGARYELVTRPPDDSPYAGLIRYLDGLQGKQERLDIMERAARGRRERVESGLLMPGAKAPYGYRWKPDSVIAGKKRRTPKPGLEEDLKTSWVVRRIFQESAKGRGQQAIAEALTAEGIRTPTGRTVTWGQSTIRCILQNQFYIGRAAAFRCKVVKDWSRGTKDGRVIQYKPQDEWVALPDGLVPALVDADTFAAVQERFALTKNRAQPARHDPSEALLRGGYAKCGYCGHTMFVHRAGGRLSYRCIRRQRFKDCPGATHVVGPLDRDAWDKVEELLLKPDVIAAELERLELQDPVSDDLDIIDRGIAQVQNQRKNLLAQLAFLDADSAADVRTMLAEKGQRLKELEAEREIVMNQREVRKQARSRLADLESWCQTVAANLRDLTFDQKRLALDALGVRVQVWRKDDRAPRIEANIPLGVTKNSISGSTDHHRPAVNRTLTLRWTERHTVAGSGRTV